MPVCHCYASPPVIRQRWGDIRQQHVNFLTPKLKKKNNKWGHKQSPFFSWSPAKWHNFPQTNCSELKMLISVCGDCMLNMYEEWRGQDVIYIHTCIRVKIKAWPWCINPSTNVQLSLARFRIKPCFCQQHRAWILHPAPTRRPACFNAQPVDSGCVSPVRLYDHTTLWLLESALTRTASRRRRTFKQKKKEKGQKRRERGDAWKKSPSNWT